jgi:hypothetical protein
MTLEPDRAIFEYRANSRKFGALGSEHTRDRTMVMVPNRLHSLTGFAIRNVQAIIGARIPNVFTRDPFTNAKLRVERRARDGQTIREAVIEIPNGNYTVNGISDYINGRIASWWIAERDPGFKLELNRRTGLVEMTIDNTKLRDSASRFALNLLSSGSEFNDVIGFGKQLIDVEGVTVGINTPRLKWFGEYIDVFAGTHDPQHHLCSIPVRDDGTMRPISCYCANLTRDAERDFNPSSIGAISFTGAIAGYGEVVFMGGNVIVRFDIEPLR